MFIENRSYASNILSQQFRPTLLSVHHGLYNFHVVATLMNKTQTKGTALRLRMMESLIKSNEIEVLYDSWVLTAYEKDLAAEAAAKLQQRNIDDKDVMATVLKDYTESVFLRRIGDQWGRWGNSQWVRPDPASHWF